MNRRYFAIGALLGALAVALGAFGAHALEDILSESMQDIYDTASRYHFIHASAIILVALGAEKTTHVRMMLWSLRMLFSGTVIFSGSLYVLSVSGWSWLGMITPIGGVFLIVGWLLAAWGGRSKMAKNVDN